MEWQNAKNYENIPGWGGAKFDPNASEGKDIAADFRRVPTVWSKLTADRAAEGGEKDGKETEKPLDPVISIYVDQPESGSAQTMGRGVIMGHTFLGIEYSRKSLITNRYERYKLQYGFYPAGTGIIGNLQMAGQNAILPGQLVDDYGHSYDVSRSYQAKPEQVNAILKASEKYAEGGYGLL